MTTPIHDPVLFYAPGRCSLSCLIAVAWTGEPFRAVRLDDDYETDSDYTKINPRNEVPALVENGHALTENSGVLNRLAKFYPETRISFLFGTPDYDQLNRALSYVGSTFHRAFRPVFMPEAFHDDPSVQKEIKMKAVEETLRDELRFVNDHVVRNGSILGHPTIADAYLFATARWAEDIYDVKKEFPELARFLARMREDTGVQFALAIESGRISKPERNFRGHTTVAEVLSEMNQKSSGQGAERIGLFTVNASVNGRSGQIGRSELA